MRSQEEITYLAARWLYRQYGDKIVLHFHDVNLPETKQEFQEIVDVLLQQRWPLPVVVIGNRLTPLPYLSYWGIIDVVESVLAEQNRPQ